MAGDIVEGNDVEDIDVEILDTLRLQERFGTLDVGVEVVNLSNNQCVATVGSGWSSVCRAALLENTVPEIPVVHVGDVLSVLPVVDDTTTDVRVPSVLVLGYQAVQTAYEANAFAVVPRDFNFGYGQVIAQEVGTGTLAPVTTEVPGDLSLLSGKLDDVLADPDLTAYLQQFVNIHRVDIQIAPADDLPAARDDHYNFVSDSALEANYGMTVPADTGVLANDSNPFDAPLRAILIDPPEYGRVWLDDDGSFRYQPSLTYIGDDHFSYVAGGAGGTSEVRTVTIVDAQHPPLVRFELHVLNDAGEPISTVDVGGEFTVQLLAHSPGFISPQDNRLSTGRLTFSPEVASQVGEVEYNPGIGLPNYQSSLNPDGTLHSEPTFPTGRATEDGTLDVDLWLLRDILEGDEQNGYARVPRGKYEVFRVRFAATAAGELDLSLLPNVAVTADGQRASSGEAIHLVDVATAPFAVLSESLWRNPQRPLDANDDGILAADPLPVDDLGLTDQAAAQLDQAQLWDTASLAEHFGTGAELELDVFNVRTNSPATTINVGDVILVRVWESVPAEGGSASYLFPVFLKAFVGLGYDTDAFTHHPRAYQLADTVELPERTGLLRTNALVAGKSGILGLVSVADSVPDGLTAASPNRVEDLKSRPEVAAYLASAINHAVLDLEVVDTAQRPVANDDSYEFVWPWGSGGITDPAVEVSAADGVLANDSAPQGERLRAVLLDVPRHGRLQLNADGSFRYQPNKSLSGSDSFSYVAISEEGTSEIRTVTIVASYPPIVDVELRTVSPDGQPITHVKIGEKFFVEMVASATDDSTMLQPITARLNFGTDFFVPAGEVEFNPEFGKPELKIVTASEGDRTLESQTVEPTGGVDHGGISLHVPGFRLEPLFEAEKYIFRIGFTADAAGDVEFQFTDFSTRSLGSHLFNLHSAVLTVTPGTVWQNPRMPLDVNGDGIISPLDVLVGINRLNAAQDRNLGEERSATDPDHTFPDANGDGIHSPLDVLVIINKLNEGSAAEGEASLIVARPVATDSSTGELPTSTAPSSDTNVQPRDEMFAAWAMPTVEDELLDSLTGDHQARPMDDDGDMKEQTDLLSVDELLGNTMRNHWELL